MTVGAQLPEFLEVQADAPGPWPEVLAPMLEGKICGAVVRGVVEPATAARAIDNLSHGADAPQPIASRYYKGHSYGSILAVHEGPGLQQYFDASRELNRWLDGPLGTDAQIRPRLWSCLSRLCGPRRLAVPSSDAGDQYALVTVRVYEPGSAIGVHSEKVWSTMDALGQLADLSHQLSFYMPLQLPQRGGELIVYGAASGDELPDPARMTEGEVHAALERLGSTRPHVGVGDLIVFSGGRHNHRVTTIEGDRSRWTIGGFMALAKDHASVLAWS